MFTRQWHAATIIVVLAGGWALWAPHAVSGQESAVATPEVVTTEGADYCNHLQQKYAAIEQGERGPPVAEAANLSVEGARLCGHGNTRAGILRLRRALVLIMHADRVQ